MITQTPTEMNEWIETLKKVIKDGSTEQKSKVNTFWEKQFGSEVKKKKKKYIFLIFLNFFIFYFFLF